MIGGGGERGGSEGVGNKILKTVTAYTEPTPYKRLLLNHTSWPPCQLLFCAVAWFMLITACVLVAAAEMKPFLFPPTRFSSPLLALLLLRPHSTGVFWKGGGCSDTSGGAAKHGSCNKHVDCIVLIAPNGSLSHPVFIFTHPHTQHSRTLGKRSPAAFNAAPAEAAAACHPLSGTPPTHLPPPSHQAPASDPRHRSCQGHAAARHVGRRGGGGGGGRGGRHTQQVWAGGSWLQPRYYHWRWCCCSGGRGDRYSRHTLGRGPLPPAAAARRDRAAATGACRAAPAAGVVARRALPQHAGWQPGWPWWRRRQQ